MSDDEVVAAFVPSRYSFLDAPSHLYKRSCPSVCLSVSPSVCPSVRLARVFFRRVLGASCAVYPALLTICTVSLFRSSFSCPNETWTITSRSREILTYSGTFVPFAGAHVIRPCVRQFANLTLMSDLFYYQGTHLSPSIGISFLSR